MSIFDKCNIEYKHILLHEGSHYPQIGCFFAVAARGQGRSIPKVTIYVFLPIDPILVRSVDIIIWIIVSLYSRLVCSIG